MRKLFIFISLMALFYSCRKDIQSTFSPYNNLAINDTVWSNNPMSHHLADSLSEAINNTTFLVDSFDNSNGRKFKMSDSLEVTIPPYSCYDPDNNMQPIIGNVKIEVLEIRKKGDYIKYLFPTTSNKNLLESGGTFFVRLSQNNHELLLTQNGSVNLKWEDEYPKMNMISFELADPRPQDFLYDWRPGFPGPGGNNVTVWDSTSFGIAKKGYEMSYHHSTGWLTCAYCPDTVVPRTRLNVILPPNFTNKNTIIFATFKDKRTLVRLSPDFSSRSFYSLNIPVNSTVTLVSISLIDDCFYWASNDISVVNANAFNISPVKTDVKAIISKLDNLQ